MTILALNSEKVTLVRSLETKNTPKLYKRMHKNLHGIEAGRASMPIKRKNPIQSLLKFLFLKLYQSDSFQY